MLVAHTNETVMQNSPNEAVPVVSLIEERDPNSDPLTAILSDLLVRWTGGKESSGFLLKKKRCKNLTLHGALKLLHR